MPSAGIHLMVLDEVIDKLRGSLPNDRNEDLLRLLTNNPEMSALGSIGPDLAYFLTTPKFLQSLQSVISWSRDVTKVFSDVGELADNMGMPNLHSRLSQVGEVCETLLVTAQTSLLDSMFDLLYLFHGPLAGPSKIQKDEDEFNWLWGDVLHWRPTNDIAKNILAKGDLTGNEAWKAFAYGYMTHLATDTVGHAYTNQVVGGPARAWETRHHIAENFMDAHVYFTEKNIDINNAKIYERFNLLKNTSQLADFCQMFSSVLTEQVEFYKEYQINLPPAPSAVEINNAFELMVSAFELITNNFYLAPPTFSGISIPPLPGEAGSLTNELENLFPSTDESWSIVDFLEAIFAGALFGLTAAIDLIKFALDILSGIATYPLAAALYLVQAALYKVYRALRWFLVIDGISYPLPDELDSWLGAQFINSGKPTRVYPHQMPDEAWNFEPIKMGGRTMEVVSGDFPYLHYPKTPLETVTTVPSPYYEVAPVFFIRYAIKDKTFYEKWLREIPGPSEQNTENLKLLINAISTKKSSNAIGNAIEFSLDLMHSGGEMYKINLDQNENTPPLDHSKQLNLDADRGYGYFSWRYSGGLPNGVNLPLNYLLKK